MAARIVYLGNFSQAHCTETHVALSLESLGHEVTRLQEGDVDLADINRATWGADLFLWTRTEDLARRIPAADMLAWLADKRALGLLTASYHLDLYAGLKRGAGLETDPFWRTELVFTPDGGSPEFFARHGIDHVYLRPGVYGAECVPGTPRPELAADVVFVGSGSARTLAYHPEWTYRGELLKHLLMRFGRRFVKHGGPPENGGRSFIRNADLNDLYASARVVVGDTLCLGPEDATAPRFTHARYWSDRVYETVGRGGFLIHPRIVGLDDEFTDGEHLVFYDYGDFDQLDRLIDHWTRPENDAERRRIAAAGQAMVRERCSYAARMRELLTVSAERSAQLAEALDYAVAP